MNKSSQMGVTSIFKSEHADLSGLFMKKSPEKITESHQKLFLNVNEAGCGTKTIFTNSKIGILTIYEMLLIIFLFVRNFEVLGAQEKSRAQGF